MNKSKYYLYYILEPFQLINKHSISQVFHKNADFLKDCIIHWIPSFSDFSSFEDISSVCVSIQSLTSLTQSTYLNLFPW